MIFLLKYFKLCEYSCDIGLVDLSIGKFDGGVIGEQLGYTGCEGGRGPNQWQVIVAHIEQ